MQGIGLHSPGRYEIKITYNIARLVSCLTATMVLVTHTQDLYAVETSTSLSGGVYVTSNAYQSSTPVPDSYAAFVWTGTYKNKTPRLDADVKGSVEATYFSVNGDYIFPRADAKVNTVLWKNRLDWYLQDRMEVVRIDTLLPDIKTNQEIANVLITGPTGMARFGPKNRLIGELRVENSTFQTSTDKNADKRGGALRWLHDISPIKQATAEIEAQSVHGSINYQKYKGFLTYKQRSELGLVTLKGGDTLIRNYFPDDFRTDEYSLEYTRRINSRGGLTFSSGKSLSDTGDTLVTPVTPTDPLTRDAGLFISRDTSLGYTYAYAENTALVSVFHRERDYLSTAISEISNGVNANYYKRIGRSSSWTLSGAYLQTRYSDFASTDNEYEVSAEYGFDINKEVTWKAGVLGRARRSPIAGRSFDEYVVSTKVELKRKNVHP